MGVTERRIPISDEALFEMKQTMTYAEIYKKTGIKPSTVQMSLTRHGYLKPVKDRPKDKKCPICGEMFGGDVRKQYCSKQCKDISYKMSKSATRSARQRYTGAVLVDKDINIKKLYNRDKGRCYICGCLTSFEDKHLSNRGNIACGKHYPSIDHVIPISKGGLHSWSNVKLACLWCNQSKGAKMMGRRA